MSVTIQSSSWFQPEKIYTNEDFFREFPETIGAGLEKIGVVSRAIASEDDVSSDLALKAAQKLLKDQNFDKNKLGLLVYCSADFDYYTPATACVLHGKLDLPHHCGAFDLTLGCSAFIYALSAINGMLQLNEIDHALLLTASTLTRLIHPKDRPNRFLFGDAGSATLISRSGNGSLGPFVFGTDGKGFEKIIVRDGYLRHPLSDSSYKDEKDEYGNITNPASFYMDGMNVFLFSLRIVPKMLNELFEKAHLNKNEIDLFIFHQPNVFLNETLRKKLDIPENKFVHCMDKFGNTVQATIPIAICESMKNGRLKPGMTVVLAGFGVGLSWSACIARF
ncbi:MAG: ketoacyl-ACP synthase III [Bacteroidetes bacterium]|nr:ketoacyl-ACP synthase III [Bacteroidota bacterium]